MRVCLTCAVRVINRQRFCIRCRHAREAARNAVRNAARAKWTRAEDLTGEEIDRLYTAALAAIKARRAA